MTITQVARTRPQPSPAAARQKGALSVIESHEILLAAARQCAGDAEQDFLDARRRRDAAGMEKFTLQRDKFAALAAHFDTMAPAGAAA